MLLGALLVPVSVAAQTLGCQGLRAEIDASSSVGGQSEQYASALRRQRSELQRTQAYSDSIGCSSNFLFNAGPVDCDAIASRIERMRENISQLQQQMQGGSDDADRRRALVEQYNSACSMGSPGEGDPNQSVETLPLDPGAAPMPDDGPADNGGGSRHGRVRALCVRSCDGGYFPITEDADAQSVSDFDQLCKALCPGTPASLYTAAPSAGIETAVAADGTPYTSLSTAFKYQKSFDATCSCKPPHRSWVEALANAETLIESHKGDVTVTQKLSDAMARPDPQNADARPAASVPASARKSRKSRTARKAAPPAPVQPDPAAGAPPPDLAGQDVMQQLRQDAPTL